MIETYIITPEGKFDIFYEEPPKLENKYNTIASASGFSQKILMGQSWSDLIFFSKDRVVSKKYFSNPKIIVIFAIGKDVYFCDSSSFIKSESFSFEENGEIKEYEYEFSFSRPEIMSLDEIMKNKIYQKFHTHLKKEIVKQRLKKYENN